VKVPIVEQKDFQTMIGTITRDCHAVRLRLLNRVITSVYDEALRPLGIRVSQMNILVAVAAFGPVRPKDVSRVLKIETSTMSRNVERMKMKGWLNILPGEDARTQLLSLRPEGRALIEQVYPAWQAAQRKAVSILGINGVSALSALGDRLLGGHDDSA
jgi:DNA-binding MarR family transcriptional regulator